MEIKVNILAILVAVVVNFFLGFIWYTPLFGKTWGKEMGYDPDMKPEKSNVQGLVIYAYRQPPVCLGACAQHCCMAIRCRD
ncbi:MAG: DUF1761 domain-containing protein [Bacteroidales bacterium]|nr:DUF1761 domain-containing protein [Bacteroidales bacterium]